MYVFFFKQKTAYEMRISDWSSDVCSSDLTNRKLQVRIATEQRTIVQAMAAGLAVSKADPESQADALAHLIALAAQTEDFTFYDVREIGRASCRERVCQYV